MRSTTLALILIVIAGLTTSSCRPRPKPEDQGSAGAAAPAAPTAESVPGRAGFAGVSFDYDPSVFEEVQGERAPASPLQGADDKPDDVWPEHIHFAFSGLPSRSDSSEYEMTLCVYPIDAYKEAYSVSPDLLKQVTGEFAKLKTLIASDPKTWKGEVPFLPFFDAPRIFASG